MPSLQFREANGVKSAAAGSGCVTCGAALRGASDRCGACARKRMMKIGAGVFIAAEFGMAAAFISMQQQPAHGAATRSVAPQMLAEQLVPQQAPQASAELPQGAFFRQQTPMRLGASWQYFNTHDPVLGDVVRHAQITSVDPIQPANAPRLPGLVRGLLDLASGEHTGKVVSVSFPRVKTACAVKACAVRAIFDETQPMVFTYTDASAGASTVLKLNDYDRFTQRLAVSHDLTIVASVGTGHDPVMGFNVSNFRRVETASRAHKRGAIQLAAR